jgi:RNA polymerase sigma-70 factor (ECF subfamily)
MNCEPQSLYQLFRQRIYGLILKRVRQKDLAEEMTSEAFYRICNCKADGKECNNPKAYLYQVAMNLLTDYYKKKKNQFELSEDNSETIADDTDAGNLNTEVSMCLLLLIGQLPEKYKEAIYLADIEEIPQIEMARRLGISFSGAKSRVQRGRQQLKDLLLRSYQIEVDGLGNVTSCVC